MNDTDLSSLSDNQRGMSLIELMIAISLSMILILGVIQIFSSSKQTSRVQNALAHIQENARFALDILSRDIRMAGQLGCNNNAAVNYPPTFKNSDNNLFGFDSNLPNASVLLEGDSWSAHNNIVDETDTLIILSATANTIAPDTAEAGDPLVISDCDNADIFIAGEEPIDMTSDTAFSKQYSSSAELARLNYAAYYIRKSGNSDTNNLYRSKVGGAGIVTTPLLEDIDDFQVEYGEDINGDGSAIHYLDADDANLDSSKISTVRIHLLFSSQENNLALNEQHYWFKGVLCTPDEAGCDYKANPDKKLYRSLSTTIQLRNTRLGT